MSNLKIPKQQKNSKGGIKIAYRIGRYRVGLNNKANAFAIIMQIVILILWFYVGDQLISVVMGMQRTLSLTPTGGVYGAGPTYVTYHWVPTTNVFYNSYKLMGIHTDDGNFAGGLVGVVGLIMAIAILIQAIRITRV